MQPIWWVVVEDHPYMQQFSVYTILACEKTTLDEVISLGEKYDHLFRDPGTRYQRRVMVFHRDPDEVVHLLFPKQS